MSRLPPLPDLDWPDADNSAAPFAREHGDVYFSGEGLSEKRAVFLTGCRTPGELRPFEQVLPELREELRTKLQATERKAVWDAVQERAQVDPAAVKALSDAHYRPIQIKP